MLRFTIRDVLWLTVVVALGVAFYARVECLAGKLAGFFMRVRLIFFGYVAVIVATVYLLDILEFSSGQIIAAACFLTIAGAAMMLRRVLLDNSN